MQLEYASSGSSAWRRLLAMTILAVVAVFPEAASGAAWEMRVTDGAALEISHLQVPVVQADYCFCGPKWSWAAVKARTGEPHGADKTFFGEISALDIEFAGTVRSLTTNRVCYTWNLEAGRDLADIVGGGIEFRLVGDSPSLGDGVPAPVLLGNNTGWRWDVSDGGPIVVEFDRPCPNVYFERGNKNQIRAMFVGQNLAKGSHTVSMTVTLPSGGMLLKTLAERYGPIETSKWYSGALLYDKSPVDLSFLNHKPAGKFGFVKADGDKLVFENGDGIGEGFAEMQRRSSREGGAEGKGYCYFNERIEQLMKDFNAKYMSHVNTYTSLAYKDDPAIMGLLITNENDITSHFGNLMLADKNNPWHNRIFESRAREFAERHGLDAGRTLQTWVPGPSKLFLADTEYRWNRRMLAALEQVGVKVPVSTTQMWGGMSLYGLPSLTAGGIIDVHSYGQAEALSANPRFKDNYVSYLAAGQADGKPVSITEWNVPYPGVDRFTAPLYVASISALQGCDAPMIYNYSQRAFGKPSRQDTWATFSDVALTGMMPAAALLYRQGHVADAAKSYCIMLDKESLYMNSSHPKNMASLRTLVEQSKVTIGLPDTKELDWDKQTNVQGSAAAITDQGKDFIPPGQDFVRSDTGQLTRNWVKGYQIIDTEKSQAVHGWVGGESLHLKHAEFDVTTPKAAVAVSSLDGQAIGKSRKVLISAVARAVPSEGGRMPMLSEPVEGRIAIAGPGGTGSC